MRRFLFCAFIASTVLGSAGIAGATAARTRINIAPLNDSGETGAATLEQQSDGSLLVTVLTHNAGPDAQPVHIHKGTCDNSTAIAFRLQNAVNGKSQTRLKGVKLSDLTSSANVINVHKSAKEMGTYVACGRIRA
ncbi:MAG: hypothetical protein QOJ39_2239 [Candidatus Eremiobacteraeota bacterium]|jgi:Cu/Zn superoxide dismutase|nr:hypothetical protein [Candidatus Eremiobacteraeota bacterium]